MKKTLISGIILLSLFGLMICPATSSAALDPPDPETDVTKDTTPPTNSVEEAINNVMNWFFIIVLIIAVMFLLYAGFLFITAGGDPDKVNSARQNVMYAMVGVAVAVLAKGIVALVQGLVQE
ncbi:MAG TPA: pilin [Candidatus Paceibacterota bacterium]|nr:pilin [Candidatus Pacearchaeota archaeon]HRZ51041.1 pilin [Candidatus Paceibacterota bacterium]HSA36800.1 pilin [Candidatus Paceibacterota bacterium]